MSKTIYIGKPSKHIGKTAFQILANLKNFGVGRMLTRHEFDAFPEPSYHIVKKVEARMDPELKFGTIWCETVVRGKRLPGVRPLKITYRPDFRLIPKDEEQEFVKDYKIENLGDKVNILPKYYSVPPLMREFLLRHERILKSPSSSNETSNQNEQFKIPFVYQNQKDAKKEDADLFWVANRIAKDDQEKPTVPFDGKFRFNSDYLKHCSKS